MTKKLLTMALLPVLLLTLNLVGGARAMAVEGWTGTYVVYQGVEYLLLTRPALGPYGVAWEMIPLGPVSAPKPVPPSLLPLGTVIVGGAYASYLAGQYNYYAGKLVTPVGSDPAYNLTPYENPANWWQNFKDYWLGSSTHSSGYAG